MEFLKLKNSAIKSNIKWITIGQLSERSGVSVSAIRYYEAEGLLQSIRSAGGQRRFLRGDIRRLSFVLITQQFGFSIAQIKQQLDVLPQGRNPTKRDWERISRSMRDKLDQRIADMSTLRDRLDGCIGCGCLSLAKCKLYNPQDAAARRGAGPRFLLGDSSDAIVAKDK